MVGTLGCPTAIAVASRVGLAAGREVDGVVGGTAVRDAPVVAGASIVGVDPTGVVTAGVVMAGVAGAGAAGEGTADGLAVHPMRIRLTGPSPPIRARLTTGRPSGVARVNRSKSDVFMADRIPRQE